MTNMTHRVGGYKRLRRLLQGTSVFILTCSWVVWSQDSQEDAAGKARLATWEQDIQANEQVIAEKMVIKAPQGDYYESLVPETLDLADRGALALNMLIGMLDPAQGYEMYRSTNFATKPAYISHGRAGGHAEQMKLVEALPQMRLMSGSKQGLEIEQKMMLRIMAMSWEDGQIYAAPAMSRPWMDPKFAEVAHLPVTPRMLQGMLYWYQYDGNPLWLEQADKIYRTIRDVLVRYDGPDRAYLPPLFGRNYPKSGYPASLPPLTYDVDDSFTHGSYLRAIATYVRLTGDREALQLAHQLANTLRSQEFWVPEIEDPSIVSEERGHYSAHLTSRLIAHQGLLEYALVTNNTELKQFVRQGYEYTRNFGIPEIGWFPTGIGVPWYETCSAVRPIMLAVRLSEAGVGDYWEDVDRAVRNFLVEAQFVDREQLEKISEAAPPHQVNFPMETDDRAIERSLGTFVVNGMVTQVSAPSNYYCCNHNGAQALYHVWQGIVQDKGNGMAQINLLLNRASRQLDLDSYLPYQGKIVIRNKTARRIYVRIPNWVSKGKVICRVAAQKVKAEWLNNYLVFGSVDPGVEIVVEFPMVEQTLRRTNGAWGTTYTIRLRGNTVMDISPRAGTASAKVSDGTLVVAGNLKLIAANVETRDVQVSVEAKNDVDASILLRFTNKMDFLQAYYNRSRNTIGLYEWYAGLRGTPPKVREIDDLGSDIHLSARVEGSQASFTVSDGAKTFSVSQALNDVRWSGLVEDLQVPEEGDPVDALVSRRRNLTGAVGLLHNEASPQRYDNFRVIGLDGRVIFEDEFSSPNGPPVGWLGANLGNYLVYQREHMHQKKALLKKRTRFAPARNIIP